MSIVLYNPTNEMFRVTFGGRSFKLEPDSKTKVDDACGRHVLNEYSQRGLCSLDYGDEGTIEKIAAAGRTANEAFKVKQIEDYNQQNEARKAIGLPFNPATKKLLEYAEELSLVLSQPYKVSDTVAKRSKELEAENVELKDRVNYMQTQMNKMAEKMNRFFDAEEAKKEKLDKILKDANQQEEKAEIPEPDLEAEKKAFVEADAAIAKKRGPKTKVKDEE